MSGRGQQAAVASSQQQRQGRQRRQARSIPSEQAASGRQAEAEGRPWWIDLLIDRFDAKIEASEARLRGELHAIESRLVRWILGAGGLLFFALRLWPPGG